MILEAERHRYDADLSSISGQDIEAHGNDLEQAIRCVRNWLSEHPPRNAAPLPGPVTRACDEAAQSPRRLSIPTHIFDEIRGSPP